MFFSPEKAIKEGWITGITDQKSQVQPNAIDFTLDSIRKIQAGTTFTINKDGKTMRKQKDMAFTTVPNASVDTNWWRLEPHAVYDGLSDVYVNLPTGVAAILFIRSTFNRNGIYITSGLYDSGYTGHVGFAIHNNAGIAFVGEGTPIGQIAFVSSDSAEMYAGGWNHDEGTSTDTASNATKPTKKAAKKKSTKSKKKSKSKAAIKSDVSSHDK